MPTYEYKCKVCGRHYDVEQSFTDDTLTTMEGCEVTEDGLCQLKKVFSAVGISFKGEGFYRNDSRSTRSSSTTGSSGDGDSSSGGGSSSSSSSSDSASSSSSSSSSGSGSGSGSGDGGSKASSASGSGSSN